VAANATALGTTAAGTTINGAATLDVQANIGTEPISEDFASLITSTGTGRSAGPSRCSTTSPSAGPAT